MDGCGLLLQGIVEILQAMLCDLMLDHTTHPKCIRVKISTLDDDCEDGPQPCNIKVLGDMQMNFRKLSKDYFPYLTCIVKEAQNWQKDTVICVVSQGDNHKRTQEKFMFCEKTHCLKCCETGALPTKSSPHMKISFHVFEKKEKIAELCHRLRSYLQRLKLFHSEIHLSFQLQFFGLDYHNDICADVEYLSSSLCEKENLPPLVVTPSYYLRNKEKMCSPIHVKRGDRVPLHPPHIESVTFPSLCAQATAILIPYRQEGNCCRHGFINIMFSGPGLHPVEGVTLPAWRPDFISEVFQTCECHLCDNPDPFCCPIQLHVTCKGANFNRMHMSYVIYVILSIKPNEPTDPQNATSLFLLNKFRSHLSEWSVSWKEEMQLAVDSAVKSLWDPEFIVRNKTPFEVTLSHAVPVITDSILSIVTSSTNENFRQACFGALQVTNASDLRKSLSTNLHKLATDKYHQNSSQTESSTQGYSQQEFAEDSFEELGAHGNITDMLGCAHKDTQHCEHLEEKESSSQEWYDDTLEDLDDWTEK